jgi:hypothetical protein
MKTIAAAVLAVSVLAATSLPVLAADDEFDFPSNIFDKIERHLP